MLVVGFWDACRAALALFKTQLLLFSGSPTWRALRPASCTWDCGEEASCLKQLREAAAIRRTDIARKGLYFDDFHSNLFYTTAQAVKFQCSASLGLEKSAFDSQCTCIHAPLLDLQGDIWYAPLTHAGVLLQHSCSASGCAPWQGPLTGEVAVT